MNFSDFNIKDFINHSKILTAKEVSEKHREGESLAGIKIFAQDLSGADLSGANLEGAMLVKQI